MEVLVHWFTDNLSQHISREMVIFIISMIPILEICIVGNIIPIPFILLFIRQIFKLMKKTKIFR